MNTILSICGTPVRATVWEAVKVWESHKQLFLDIWNEISSSQEDKKLLSQLHPAFFKSFAEQNYFLEVEVLKIEGELKLINAEELVSIFYDVPFYIMWKLRHSCLENLVEYLRSVKLAVATARLKLSKLQKKILLNLYRRTLGGIATAKWIPAKSLGANTLADCSAISRALKRLKERGLICHSLEGQNKMPKRTTHVKLSHLGFLVTKHL